MCVCVVACVRWCEKGPADVGVSEYKKNMFVHILLRRSLLQGGVGLLEVQLQHTATHSSTLQHAATHCMTRQHTATHCNTLQHTATHCNTLQRAATHCNTLQHTATHGSTLQHTATHCNTLQHTYCNTLQHIAAHCSTPHAEIFVENTESEWYEKNLFKSSDHPL